MTKRFDRCCKGNSKTSIKDEISVRGIELSLRNTFSVIAAASMLAFLSPEALAQEDGSADVSPDRTELWGGLYSGMDPNQAKLIIEAVEGVKRVKYEERQDGYSALDVNVNSDFTLANKKAKIELIFRERKLFAVKFLVTDDREWGKCVVGGAKAFNFFNEALASKYTLVGGLSHVDSTLVDRLALQSRAAAFEPYGADKVDDIHAVYTDDNDLLVQATLETTGKKHSSSAVLNCSQYGYLDGRLRLTYMSRSDNEALATEKNGEHLDAVRSAADDL